MAEPTPATIPLVLATRNRKKGEEMVRLLVPPWESNPRLARLQVTTLEDHPRVPEVVEDAETFVDEFIDRTRRSPEYSSALYAAGVRHKVSAGAVHGVFQSMVELSDHGELLSKFLSLPCPRMFMYGQPNASLSYLTTLAANGVELAEIPHSGHWPMYSNPVATWERIARFQTGTALQ